MKAIYTPVIATGVIVALTGCSGMRLSNSNAFADDVYYDGSAPARRAAASASATKEASADDIASYDARVSSYNAKAGVSNSEGRDFSQIQQYYANAGTSTGDTVTAATNKSVALASDDAEVETASGYWVDGFYGTDADQSYAERIVKFHRPLVSVNYYSPFFTAARYSGDWNIYVDEYGSTYLVPTWTNPWYSDYYYGSGIAFDWYWGRASWRIGWGWSGWYNGWDFGWGYGGWGLAWGWPYHHHHHGWGWGAPYHHGGPGWHDGGFGGNDRGDFCNRPVHAARATAAPQTYSGGRTRGETVTTNPNGERAAQRYRDAANAERSRSYTRTVDGNSTVSSRNSIATSSNPTNSRRTTAGAAQSATSRQSATANGSNTRRSNVGTSSSSSNSGTVSRSSSRSSYTPSRSTTRTSAPSSSSSRSSSSYSQNNTRRSSSSSSYSPTTRSRSYSSGSTRSSSSSRSYTSTPSRSFSSGSSSVGRSSGGFSGGGRSSGGGGGRSSGGGGRSR